LSVVFKELIIPDCNFVMLEKCWLLKPPPLTLPSGKRIKINDIFALDLGLAIVTN
jgi:hypothetical protein